MSKGIVWNLKRQVKARLGVPKEGSLFSGCFTFFNAEILLSKTFLGVGLTSLTLRTCTVSSNFRKIVGNFAGLVFFAAAN